jgi:dTDP-4-dehydrorhamnose reductase
MRILLTGTSGQVGGALEKALHMPGQILTPSRTEFDLSYPASLPAALDYLAPELIINPAAYTAVDRAEDEMDIAFRVNAEAPSVMARWSARRSIPFVHFSTDYVFSGLGDRPWREDDHCDPLSVYGKSKLQGELGVRDAGGVHLIVRTSWVYASQGKNFFRTVIRLAREFPELRMVSDQVGAPTSARSIADAIAMLLPVDISGMREAFSRAGSVVHIANSEWTSWYGFATEIVNGLRDRNVGLKAIEVVPIQSSDFPTKAVRPLNSRLDLTRAASVFGLCMPAWQDALASELDDFVKSEHSG